MTRTALNADLAALVELHTGPILEATRSARGFSSDYTGTIHSSTGLVFVKAVRDPGPYTGSLEREAAINPAVRDLSPALLWRERGHGWFALGFRHMPDTRNASFKPGSPDLPSVTASIDRIGTVTLPHAARDWPENRYDRYADDGTAAMFAGSALLHGDINPDNFLIGPDNEITIVDWAWPTHGAGFIDPACLVVQLIAAGHSPAEAEAWAMGCAAWRAADPVAVDAFARAMTRMYQRFEQLDPEPWRRAMTASATDWAEYRGQHPHGDRSASPTNACLTGSHAGPISPADVRRTILHTALYATGSFMSPAIGFYRHSSIQRQPGIQSRQYSASDQILICGDFGSGRRGG